MAYDDPQNTHDPSTGTVPPASWGDAVRAAIEYLARNKPHCRVYNNANISVATATVTALTFNSERVDVGALHSTSSNTGRITITDAGWHDVGGCASLAANVTSDRGVLIRVNGSTIIAYLAGPANNNAGNPTILQIAAHYQLAAADYVELCVYQNSGGNLNVLASGNYSPEFWATWDAA